jgi:hypothetical protein
MSPQIDLSSPRDGHGTPKGKWRIVFVILFIVVLSSGVAFFAYNYGKKGILSEPDNVVRDVGMHIILPEGTPRIGKISDTSAFTKDPFLSQSKIDDVVLFYPYEGRTVKAILWRPSEKKIVDVSLVTLPDPTTVK